MHVCYDYDIASVELRVSVALAFFRKNVVSGGNGLSCQGCNCSAKKVQK